MALRTRSAERLGNTIDSNHGAGIYITGLATDNVASDNLIGVTVGGGQVLGNWSDGVSLYSPSNTIGPGNVISQNLRGNRDLRAGGQHARKRQRHPGLQQPDRHRQQRPEGLRQRPRGHSHRQLLGQHHPGQCSWFSGDLQQPGGRCAVGTGATGTCCKATSSDPTKPDSSIWETSGKGC